MTRVLILNHHNGIIDFCTPLNSSRSVTRELFNEPNYGGNFCELLILEKSLISSGKGEGKTFGIYSDFKSQQECNNGKCSSP